MTEYRSNGDFLGRHRVIMPKGALPQAATKLDNSLPIYDNEILIDVETLNIDSASFRQMKETVKGDLSKIFSQVEENVLKMGKQQNPVTGSGGMLLGRVSDIGPKYSNKCSVSVGDNICTLVSLTLTPLIIDKFKDVRESEQIDVEGKAILFDSGVLAKIPDDIELNVALALLDVAGAPPQAERLVEEGMNVLVIGGGKSGILCAAVARGKIGNGKIYGCATRDSSVETFSSLGILDKCFKGNALEPGEFMDKVSEATDGEMVDLVINTANVEGTEAASFLSCKQGGKVYFFNMATNFQKAALGAEGVGYDVEMIIGNGYAPNHAEFTMDVYRNNMVVKEWFDNKFCER
jgi:L-erythro-3,5-diaminohexanoate dehydrogenase